MYRVYRGEIKEVMGIGCPCMTFEQIDFIWKNFMIGGDNTPTSCLGIVRDMEQYKLVKFIIDQKKRTCSSVFYMKEDLLDFLGDVTTNKVGDKVVFAVYEQD